MANALILQRRADALHEFVDAALLVQHVDRHLADVAVAFDDLATRERSTVSSAVA